MIAKERAERGRRVKLALMTSLPSKGASLLLQVIAMPIALRALGAEQFGLYAVATASITWLNLTNAGMSQALARRVAQTRSLTDLTVMRRQLGSALTVSLALTTPIAVIAAVVICSPFLMVVLGERFAQDEVVLRNGLMVALALIYGRVVLSPVDGLFLGLQRQHVLNMRGAIANVCSAFALVTAATFSPTVPFLILAIYGPGVIVQLLNVGYFLFYEQPELRSCVRFSTATECMALFRVGLAFSAVQLSVLLAADFCVLVVGRFSGPASAGTFAVMLQIIILGMSLVNMITVPLWPSLADAISHGDIGWAKTTFFKLRRFTLLYSISVATVFAFAGNTLIPYVFGNRFHEISGIVPATAAYLILVAWEHIHYMTLVGIGSIRKASIIMLMRSGLAVVAGIVAAPVLGPVSVMAAQCLSIVVTSGWYLHREVRLSLSQPKVHGAQG